MGQLAVCYVPTSSLHPHSSNPRTHTKKQVRQLADSIRTFGFTNPLLVDAEGNILAGHGRLLAAELLGMDSVPTVCIHDMTEAQKRAYAIADNKLAELAGWDVELLASELQYVTELDIEFDLTITGFDTPEIDVLLSPTPEAPPEEDAPPDPDFDTPAVSQPGDLWLLGRHRLLCGDALAPRSYDTLMNGEKAEMVFADPPYNVRINGHVSGLGSARHKEFPMASGEMNEQEFIEFLRTFMRNAAENSIDGSIHYVCMDWRHAFEIVSAGRSVYKELKNICVWAKTNGGMGSFYRSQHEFVFVFKHGTAPHINNFELGQHGRYRSNLWTHPGMNTFRPDREEKLRLHPTVKPTALVSDTILDCSNRGSIVLDPFAGSGTTIIAAERTGRRAFAIELDAHYVDVAVRRWQEETGESAIGEASGLTFAEAEKRGEGQSNDE